MLARAAGWAPHARQESPAIWLSCTASPTAHPVPWNGVCAPARLAAVCFGSSSVPAPAPPLPNSRGACCELTSRRRGVAQPVQFQDDASGAGDLPRLLRHEPRPIRGALCEAPSAGVGRPCLQPCCQRVLRRPAQPHVERVTLTRTQLGTPPGAMAALGLGPLSARAHLQPWRHRHSLAQSPAPSKVGYLQSRLSHCVHLRPRYFPRVLNGSGLSVVQFGTSGDPPSRTRLAHTHPTTHPTPSPSPSPSLSPSPNAHANANLALALATHQATPPSRTPTTTARAPRAVPSCSRSRTACRTVPPRGLVQACTG